MPINTFIPTLRSQTYIIDIKVMRCVMVWFNTFQSTKALAKRKGPLSQCENAFLKSTHGPALEHYGLGLSHYRPFEHAERPC